MLRARRDCEESASNRTATTPGRTRSPHSTRRPRDRDPSKPRGYEINCDDPPLLKASAASKPKVPVNCKILCVLSARMLNSIGVLVSYVENTWRGKPFKEELLNRKFWNIMSLVLIALLPAGGAAQPNHG